MHFFSCSTSYPEEVEMAMKSIPENIDYNIHIKPILSDRCYKCHGPDANQRKADFRIDIRENATAAVLSEMSLVGKSISPGNPKKSEVFQRIIAHDEDYMMPPPESNLVLTDYEKALITRWIENGANYKEHWSFLPPKKQALPKVEEDDWIQQDMDRFILAKIEDKELKPAEKATKEELLRRVTLDITGLPPTVEEIEQFLSDNNEKAYENRVDELLESKAYGERMASNWLDAARYADTHGYQDDGLRNVWPWRKWVIDAFNDNMPYDQFLKEQLAGDLIPNATRSQKLATGFNRNHPQTQEGGVVEEEYRVEYVADRTNTFGKAILGLTMECARCHDHKYDPISQKDYYSLSGFFNSNNDSGIVPYNGEATPTVMLPTPAEDLQLQILHGKIDSFEKLLISDEYKQSLKNWMVENDLKIEEADEKVAHFSFDEELTVEKNKLYLDGEKSAGWGGIGGKGTIIGYQNKALGKPDAAIFGDKDSRPKLVEGVDGQGIQFMGDCGVRFNRSMDYDRYQPFSVSIWVKLLKEGEKGPIFNNTNGDFEGYRGWICKLNEDGTLNFQLNHVWPDNSIDYQTVEKIKVGEWTHISMTYDGSSKAKGLRFYVNGKTPEHTLHQDNLQKSVLHGANHSNWSSYPLIIGKEKERSIQNIVMDEFQVYKRELAYVEVQQLLNTQTTEAIESSRQLEYYLLSGKDTVYNNRLEAVTELRRQENEIATDVVEGMVMNDMKVPRTTYILDRGMYDSPMEEVSPETPVKFGSLPDSAPRNRLGLADWVISENNPLTSRVQVNRLWMVIFGKGIIETQEDFGNQGNLPSHPELLDYLAVEYMENGWDTKAFLKKIFLSATYQQSSVASISSKEKDPSNRLYSRFPSHRLTAEMIRDHALASSGLLVDSIGGRSVYPYQPAGIWEALATRNATEYKQGTGSDLYRRSLYTIWKRTAPPPSMLNFDAPDRYICTVNRQKTSTPLQSLVLMNDPQYLEAAKVLAVKTVRSVDGGIDEKINYIFKSLVSRAAEAKEIELLRSYYQEEMIAFSADVKRAEALLSVGEYEVSDDVDPVETASLTMVASTVINFDEFVMKR